MAYVGGLRARLVAESTYQMISDALGDLGWFDSGRQHSPIHMRRVPVENDENIELNTLVVFSESMFSFDQELGSNLAEHRWIFWVDFYAENDAIGTHLIHDVKDICQGRFNSIGRTAPIVTIYDYTMATPPEIFVCEIESVAVERMHDFPKPWQKHWYSLTFVVVDTYGDEEY